MFACVFTCVGPYSGEFMHLWRPEVNSSPLVHRGGTFHLTQNLLILVNPAAQLVPEFHLCLLSAKTPGCYHACLAFMCVVEIQHCRFPHLTCLLTEGVTIPVPKLSFSVRRAGQTGEVGRGHQALLPYAPSPCLPPMVHLLHGQGDIPRASTNRKGMWDRRHCWTSCRDSQNT